MINIEEYVRRQSEGTLSEEEQKDFNEWLQASPDHKKIYLDFCALFRFQEIESNRSRFESSKLKSWNRIKQNISRRKKIPVRPFLFYVSAACVLLAFFVGWQVRSFSDMRYAELDVQKIQVPLGSKACVQLPDSSVVWLNSGSSLTFSRNFNQEHRVLHLNGEGYFDVKHNEELPFRVITKFAETKVLGTQFNIRAYDDDLKSEVTLKEGSLLVHVQQEKSYRLRPNQQVVIDNSNKRVKIRNVSGRKYCSWSQAEVKQTEKEQDNQLLTLVKSPDREERSKLFFDEIPLEQILKELEQAFHVTIVLDDPSLRKELFYGDFRNDETIYDIMDIITANHELHYTIENNKIILTKN